MTKPAVNVEMLVYGKGLYSDTTLEIGSHAYQSINDAFAFIFRSNGNTAQLQNGQGSVIAGGHAFAEDTWHRICLKIVPSDNSGDGSFSLYYQDKYGNYVADSVLANVNLHLSSTAIPDIQNCGTIAIRLSPTSSTDSARLSRIAIWESD
jgi:hypothetical protein